MDPVLNPVTPSPAEAGNQPMQNPPSPAVENAEQAPVNTPAQATNPNPANTPPANIAASVVSEDQVKLALRRVKDPDLQLNIVDLGLVYGVRVDGAQINVDMTLTSPGCPSGPEIIHDIEQQVKTLPGVDSVQVNLVWAPFWTPDRIEPRVRAYLGL